MEKRLVFSPKEIEKLARAQVRYLEKCLMAIIEEHEDLHCYGFTYLRRNINSLLLSLTREDDDGESEVLRGIVIQWLADGFTTPPYTPEVYAIIRKLGIEQQDVPGYDLSPPKKQEAVGIDG